MKFSLLFATIIFSNFAFSQTAVVEVALSPAGSFKIKIADVRGTVHRKGDAIEAKDIRVGLQNLQTGIALRDKHTKKYLEADKYPNAILIVGNGKGGKGDATIKIKGVEKKISGTYKIDGKKLIANFSLSLADFKIKDVSYMGVGVDDTVKLTVNVPIK